MKKTIQVINALVEEGVIEDYALGGATALLFYAEPALTYDIDIFIILHAEQDNNKLIDLSPLYKSLEAKRYFPEKEHVIIEGVPVQFIPVYNPLIEEAVTQAVLANYEGIKIKILKIEYLLAIMIDTNRPKDRERIHQLLDDVSLNQNLLDEILQRHALKEKWENQIEKQEKTNKKYL